MNLYFISVLALFEQQYENKVSFYASACPKKQKIKTSPKARFRFVLYSVFVFRGGLLKLQSDIMAFLLARL